MASTFPKVKRSSLEKHPPSQKKKSTSRPLARNRTKQIPSDWTSNAPIVEFTECFEPTENDLELNAIAYAFSKIFQPQRTNFSSSAFGDRELLSFVWFPSEATAETKKKNTFFAVEDFTSFWWHSGTQKRIGRAKQKQTRTTTEQDFSGETLSQQNIEDWLASLSCDSYRATTERSAIFAFGV